ncbi:MAG: ATP-binding protein [Chloroflexota bacterium]
MRELPSGVVTFLFTDIEGSTRLLHEHGARYADLLGEHRRHLRTAVSRHAGVEVDTQGDAFFVAFAHAEDALLTAEEILEAEGQVRVRIGIHTGTPTVTDEGYVGLDVHRAARICAAAHGGQAVVSEATRDALARDPGRDLGLHRLKDLGAPERLFQLGTATFPPLRSLNATNLPAQTGALVGRTDELLTIASLIEEARVVTLTGAGGSGKTRLALQAAAENVERFTGGVFWVPLAAINDPALVEPTIAQAIGAPGGLAAHIDEKRMLLLLDNLEQVLPDAAEPLATLVGSCPNLRLLVTSRSPLRIQGEREFPVLPLPEVDAVELFRDRAFTAEPEAAVREICRRLDGLPLAIELAAARTRLLPPDQLLARLERALPVLTGGRRDAPERQRTLRATIAWSYDLLSADERRLFDRLGVFAGGFTLEAAETVCDADIDAIGSLLEQSLLRRGDDGRLGMLVTILEFAVEHLVASDEALAILARHAEYYVALADSGNVHAEAQGGEDYEIILPELANFRAVLERSLATGDNELGMSMAVALETFWVSNNPPEGERWYKAFFAGKELPLALRARALRARGGALYISGRFDEGTDYHRQSLDVYRELGDDWGIGHVLYRLAVEAQRTGDPGLARQLAEESRLHLGPESPWAESQVLHLLGILAFHDGRRDEGLELELRSAELADQIGSRWLRLGSLLSAAEFALEMDRPAQGRDISLTALAVADGIGDRMRMAWALSLLAWAAAEEGQFERAGRLFGATEAESARSPFGQWERGRDEYLTHLDVDPGSDFRRARDEGASLSFADAVQEALAP